MSKLSPRDRGRTGRAVDDETAIEWMRKVDAGMSYRQAARSGGPAYKTLRKLMGDPDLRAQAGLPALSGESPPSPPPPVPAKRKRGRPTKLHDDELRESLERALRAGATERTAAELAGIHPQTLRNWIRSAREDPDRQVFGRELLRARAEGEVSCLERVESGEPGWQGAAWVAARCFGYRERVEQVVEVVSPVEHMTDEELRALITVQPVENNE